MECEISGADVVTAYRQLGVEPIRFKFVRLEEGPMPADAEPDDEIPMVATGCCGLTALAVARDHINFMDAYDDGENVKEALELGEWKAEGFIWGFDGHRLSEYNLRLDLEERQTFQHWYECGLAAWEAVVDAGLVTGGEG